MTASLPVASRQQLRGYLRGLLATYPGPLSTMLVLYAAATAAGLAIPWLIGDLVDQVSHGITSAQITRTMLVITACLLGQVVLTRFAQLASLRLGETVLARLREQFISNALALPLAVIEDAGPGDLTTRTSRDVDALSRSVRTAVPATVVAAITASFSMLAALIVAPWVAGPLLAGLPGLWWVTRWYLRRSRHGYLRANASYSAITATLGETIAGARTVEALDLERHRVNALTDAIATSSRAEAYNTRSRMGFFGGTEFGYVIPLAAAVLLGGYLHHLGYASLGEVTAATLYLQRLIDPLDQLLGWLDELQAGGAALARLLGIANPVQDKRRPAGSPSGGALTLSDVHFSYRPGTEVLHGITLTVRPGERLAIVGPSGSGKTTLARLLAGIAAPSRGQVTLGGVELHALPIQLLRRHVALVTQENHVFIGTLRDNLTIAASQEVTDAQLRVTLRAVEASSWIDSLAGGLDTPLGASGYQPTAAQAQQIALARLLIADPRVLILDEATSHIDPRFARRLERTMATVMAGRTVIAIAHRLYTAHDADLIAVVENGTIAELGSHHQLIARDGSYAALWQAWTSS